MGGLDLDSALGKLIVQVTAFVESQKENIATIRAIALKGSRRRSNRWDQAVKRRARSVDRHIRGRAKRRKRR
jgi:hypothetical protein